MKNLSYIYTKYKTIILSLICLLAGLIIIFKIIIPSIFYAVSFSKEIASEREKLAQYKGSNKLLNSINEEKLTQNVQMVTSALPPTKDVENIYLAINSSASKSNINLKGFSLKLGDVFQKNGKKVETIGIPYVDVSIKASNVNGLTLTAFSKALLSEFPLSKIIRISAGSEGDIDIRFYYKPYDLNKINTNILTPLTSQEEKTLQEITP